MPSIPLPGSTFTFSVPLVSQASSHVFQAAPTIAAGDFKRSINNGAFANMDNLPAVTPAAGKLVQFVVSASETTAAGEGGTIDIVGSDAAGAEWDDISICIRVGVIAANAAQLSGDATAADNLELFFDGTGYASAGSINSVTGSIGGDVAGKVLGGGSGMITGVGSSANVTYSAGVALTGRLAQASDLAALGNAGLYSYSATVDDGANPLDGVFVQCATDAGFTNVIGTTYSNASGAYTVRSDQAGAHYLRFQLAGWNFSDETVTLA